VIVTFATPVEPCSTETLTELEFKKFIEFALIVDALLDVTVITFPEIDVAKILSSAIKILFFAI